MLLRMWALLVLLLIGTLVDYPWYEWLADVLLVLHFQTQPLQTYKRFQKAQ